MKEITKALKKLGYTRYAGGKTRAIGLNALNRVGHVRVGATGPEEWMVLTLKEDEEWTVRVHLESARPHTVGYFYRGRLSGQQVFTSMADFDAARKRAKQSVKRRVKRGTW